MFDFGLDQNLERMATDDSNQIMSNVETPTFQLQILPTIDHDLQKYKVQRLYILDNFGDLYTLRQIDRAKYNTSYRLVPYCSAWRH